MKKTLYVADSHLPIWDAATRAAKDAGLSLSALVVELLARELENPSVFAPNSAAWSLRGTNAVVRRLG